MAGFETKTEVDNILVVGPSGMRADVVLKGKDQLVNFILDVRTCDPTTSDICVLASRCPGAAADAGAKEKIKKWGSYVDAQGDSPRRLFYSLMHRSRRAGWTPCRRLH